MTEKRKIQILVFALWTLAVLLFCYFYSNKNSGQQNPEEFIEKINSLDSKIDSIYISRDSILEKIDTVYIRLENNNKQYEENFNHILTNDANEDLVFFLDYINANRDRLDSVGNSIRPEICQPDLH